MRYSIPLFCTLLILACQSRRPRTSEDAPAIGIEAPELGSGDTLHLLAVPADGKVVTEERRVDDLAWIAGRWVGEGFGGVAEETWNPPMGAEGERSMVGMFRLYDAENAVNFYELMTLVEDEDGIVLRLVHLSKALRPWEEPGETTDFRLLRVSGTTAWFKGLTMHRDGDQLVVYVAMTSKDGSVREAVLRMRQAPVGG